MILLAILYRIFFCNIESWNYESWRDYIVKVWFSSAFLFPMVSNFFMTLYALLFLLQSSVFPISFTSFLVYSNLGTMLSLPKTYFYYNEGIWRTIFIISIKVGNGLYKKSICTVRFSCNMFGVQIITIVTLFITIVSRWVSLFIGREKTWRQRGARKILYIHIKDP